MTLSETEDFKILKQYFNEIMDEEETERRMKQYKDDINEYHQVVSKIKSLMDGDKIKYKKL